MCFTLRAATFLIVLEIFGSQSNTSAAAQITQDKAQNHYAYWMLSMPKLPDFIFPHLLKYHSFQYISFQIKGSVLYV